MRACAIAVAVDHVAVRERREVQTDTVKEMAEYERDKKYMEQCQKSFNKWYSHDKDRGQDKVNSTLNHCLVEYEAAPEFPNDARNGNTLVFNKLSIA